MKCSELADVIDTIERCVGKLLSSPEKTMLYKELLTLLDSSADTKN